MSAANSITHCVFFKLEDDSAAKRQTLIADCYEYLTRPNGVVSLHAGARVEDLVRPVNDQSFDVSLVVVFESRLAHDEYQDHPDHVAFIERNKSNWSQVRVFDADART